MQTNAQVIESYLNKNGLKATGYLAEAIAQRNWWHLRYVAFAIRRLHKLHNLAGKIAELARIEKGNNEAQRRYYNQHFEFVSIWFVADSIGHRIVEIESHSHKITSPNRIAGKYCDILAEQASNVLYFDAKDFSAETLSLYPHPRISGVSFFEPAHPRKIMRWIENQIKECVAKGANFAICRVPPMGLPETPVFGRRWVTEIFPMHKQVAKREYDIKTSKNVPSFFHGVYLIWKRRHLLLRFTSVAH